MGPYIMLAICSFFLPWIIQSAAMFFKFLRDMPNYNEKVITEEDVEVEVEIEEGKS